MRKPNYLLRAARESQHWTQEDLAERIGCSASVAISRWESGAVFPGRYYRDKLCNLFGKSAQELGLVQDNEEEIVLAPPESLFPFNEPLLNPEEMYGRKRESTTLLARTYRKASTSIVGPRRIGKTWLVQHLRLVAPRQLGSRFRIGYLDATTSRCRTVEGFAIEALRKLELPTGNANEGLVSLDEGLQELVAKKCVPVLCIDEFEGLGNRQEFTLDFFRGLRAMTHTSDLALVIISRNPLHQVVGKDIETSGFFNIFDQVALKPFNLDEAERFIRHKSVQAGFTPQEREYLWKYGRDAENGENAWSPLRLQLVGKLLLEEKGLKHDPGYRQRFEQQLESIYRGVVY